MKKLLVLLSLILFSIIVFATNTPPVEASPNYRPQAVYIQLVRKDIGIDITSGTPKLLHAFVFEENEIPRGQYYVIPVPEAIYNLYEPGDYILLFFNDVVEQDVIELYEGIPE